MVVKDPRFGDLSKPEFYKASKVHDWRTHVGENTQSIWHTLDDTQRLAIAMDAWDRAAAEEWE